MKTKRLFNRRQFLFSLSALFGTAFSVRHLTAWAAEGLPPGGKALSESDKMATALGYKQDATKADSKKYPQLNTPEGKKQRCLNCNFYKEENANWGKCQLLQNGSVSAQGWCASWVKKI